MLITKLEMFIKSVAGLFDMLGASYLVNVFSINLLLSIT